MDPMSLLSIGGSLLGALGSGDSKQSASASKEPWGPAQSWLTSNLGIGQALQNQYMANPLSAAQQQAYGNAFNTSGMGRNIAMSVLPQLSGGSFFDRSNPTARPAAFNMFSGGSLGLGGGNVGGVSGNQFMPSAPVQATPAAQPTNQTYTGQFDGTRWLPVIDGQRFVNGDNFPLISKAGDVIGYRHTGEGGGK